MTGFVTHHQRQRAAAAQAARLHVSSSASERITISRQGGEGGKGGDERGVDGKVAKGEVSEWQCALCGVM